MPMLPVGDRWKTRRADRWSWTALPGAQVAMASASKVIGALSVETVPKQINTCDIDGIVVGDGFSPRMVEAFLTMLAQEPRFRDIPIAVIGEAPPPISPRLCGNIDHVTVIRSGLSRAWCLWFACMLRGTA